MAVYTTDTYTNRPSSNFRPTHSGGDLGIYFSDVSNIPSDDKESNTRVSSKTSFENFRKVMGNFSKPKPPRKNTSYDELDYSRYNFETVIARTRHCSNKELVKTIAMILFALLCFVIFIIGIILSVTNTGTSGKISTEFPPTRSTTKEIGNMVIFIPFLTKKLVIRII